MLIESHLQVGTLGALAKGHNAIRSSVFVLYSM